MKKLPFIALCSCLFLVGSDSARAQVLYDGSPYTGWDADYTGNEPHTIGLWKFDNPSPGADSYTGVDYTTSTINVSKVTTGVPGKFAQGISILDTDVESRGYLNAVNTTGIFNASALSVEIWYQTPSTVDTNGWIFSSLGSASNYGGVGLDYGYTNAGKLTLTAGNGTGPFKAFSLDSPILTADTWYHFAITFENVEGNGAVKIFMNGNELGGTTFVNFGNLASSDRRWVAGNRNISTFSSLSAFLGTYDNFRISDVAYNYAPVPEPYTTASLLLSLPALYFFHRVRRAS